MYLLNRILIVIAFLSIGSLAFANPEQSLQHLKHIQGIAYQYTDLRVNDRTVIRGIPGAQHNLSIKQLATSEIAGKTFRHYTAAALKTKILESRMIKAGPVAYVNSPFIFVDLTGVFLTLPNCTPEQVGLDSKVHTQAVDLVVNPAYPVLRIEPCIYLIPGPGPKPAWMEDRTPAFGVGF